MDKTMDRIRDKQYADLCRFNELMKNSKATLSQTIQQLEYENKFLKMHQKIIKKLVIVVEDGSVDVEKLENAGFVVIVYKQGATPPFILDLESIRE